jgi:predicted peptidase
METKKEMLKESSFASRIFVSLAQLIIVCSSLLASASQASMTKHPAGLPYGDNGYLEYLPPNYETSGLSSPLIIFFHGIGENGSGNEADLDLLFKPLSPPRLIQNGQWPLERPFVVLAPQHAGKSCPEAAEVHNFIAFAKSQYNVDPNRIYLTGLSCGALGLADYFAVSGDDDKIAAAALIAGDLSNTWESQKCSLIENVALWTFHGDSDDVVDIAGDNYAMPNFNACPQPRKDVQYTIYPGVTHDSWSRTYDLSAGNDIYAWFLKFGR